MRTEQRFTLLRFTPKPGSAVDLAADPAVTALLLLEDTHPFKFKVVMDLVFDLLDDSEVRPKCTTLRRAFEQQWEEGGQ